MTVRLAVLSTLHRLELTKDQAQAFYDAALKTADVRAKYQERMDRLVEEQKEAYTQFRTEDVANKGFKPETERLAGKAEHEGQEANKKYADAVAAIEKALEPTLDERQTAVIREFNPRSPLPPPRAKKGEEHPKKAVETADNKGKIREEIGEIHKEKYGSFGPLGKFLVCPQTVAALAKNLGKAVPANVADVSDDRRACEKSVNELRADINLLNLLNGIYFTTHQVSHLINYAKEAQERRPSEPVAMKGIDASTAAEAKASLEKMIAEYEAGREPSPEMIREAFKIRRKIAGEPPRPGMEKKESKGDRNLGAIADEIAGLLFDNQKQTLIDYNPCLIPPKNLKDPVRVGQANDGGQQTKLLERIRKIPDDKYDANKKEIIDRAIAQVEEHGGKFDDKERTKHVATLSNVFDEVRAMSDVDFELEKGEIAKGLSFLHKLDTLKETLKEMMGDDAVLREKIIVNLLHPRIVPLLETRLRQLKDGHVAVTGDMDKLKSPAESCKNGKCAVKD